MLIIENLILLCVGGGFAWYKCGGKLPGLPSSRGRTQPQVRSGTGQMGSTMPQPGYGSNYGGGPMVSPMGSQPQTNYEAPVVPLATADAAAGRL